MENKHDPGAARFGAFTDCITSLARNVLEDVGDEQLKIIFTECVNAHNDPGRVKPMTDKKMKKIRQVLIETPLPYIRRDIEEGFEDIHINEKFKLLLELQDKYKNRKTAAWRPPSDPHQHMAALRVAAKRELLDKYQILVSMKRRQVDHLKDQIKEKKASCDFSRAATKLNEVKRNLEMIHDLNARFSESHEKVVERIAQEIEKNNCDRLKPML